MELIAPPTHAMDDFTKFAHGTAPHHNEAPTGEYAHLRRTGDEPPAKLERAPLPLPGALETAFYQIAESIRTGDHGSYHGGVFTGFVCGGLVWALVPRRESAAGDVYPARLTIHEAATGLTVYTGPATPMEAILYRRP